MKDIFARPAPKVREEPTAEEVAAPSDSESEAPLHENDLRNRRTVFVGNVSLATPKARLEKVFGEHGRIEKAWERSVPVETESKAPVKAKIIQKKWVEGAVNKSVYLLFEEEEAARAAVQALKGLELDGRHLRVSVASEKNKDFKTTVFVGNVDFKADEEAVRQFFGRFGEVEGVRLVRDPLTHVPRGFCFVRFTGKEGYLQALQANGCEFGGRCLRIGKAVKTPQPYYDFAGKSSEGVAKAIKKLRSDKPGSRRDRRAKERAANTGS